VSIAYFLIGLPASGKSTWRAAHLEKSCTPTVTISSDDLIDQYATEHGITYSQAFKEMNLREVDKKLEEQIRSAVLLGVDIIIDRTNLTRKIRKKFLQLLPSTYWKKAVVFELHRDELQQRLDKRAETTGKFIPDHVIDNMASIFTYPDLTEFDEIVNHYQCLFTPLPL